MALEEAFDKQGNVYYIQDGKPIDGIIDPSTGLFVAGVESLEELSKIRRDPFTGDLMPDIEAESMLPRVGKSLVKIFQYLWHSIFVIPVNFWLPLMG